MRFWDSSALVPLLVAEERTESVTTLVREDASLVVWWASRIECASAIARLERDAELDQSGTAEAFARLDLLAASWNEVQPVESVRLRAIRLLRVHALRSADALQLSAALAIAEDNPASVEIVTYDEHLRTAALKEGARVLG